MMIWKRAAAVGLAALLASGWALVNASGQGQDTPAAPTGRVEGPARLDGALAEHLERSGLPALAAAVVRSAGVEAIGVAGVRRRGSDVEITIDDKWHLGSCGKAMTATMIARLVERGDLRWETTIAEGLPALGEAVLPEYRQMTLVDLLAHRARLGGGSEPPGNWERAWKREGAERDQRDVFVRAVLAHPPIADAGAFLYSNAGYAVAGHIAEEATGTPWEALMQEQVWGPLGIVGAGTGVPWVGDPPLQPWGHSTAEGGTRMPIRPGDNADNPPSIGPAGTMHMPIAGWAEFIRLHLRGARGEAGLLLEPETFTKLHTPAGGDGAEYALGWGVSHRDWAKGLGDHDTGRVLTHSGSNNSWFCVVWVAPEIDLAVLVATNAAGGDTPGDVDRVAWSHIQNALKTPRPAAE